MQFQYCPLDELSSHDPNPNLNFEGSDDAKIIRLRHKLCTVARTIQTISGIFIPKILPVYEGR